MYRTSSSVESYVLACVKTTELPLRPLRGLQETRVATREESGVLGFPSRRGLIPWVSLVRKPEIPVAPRDEH